MNPLAKGFEEARKINRQFGKSYYFATWFFPKTKRKHTYALYAFFRIPDEIVDNPGTPADKTDKLNEFERRWKQALNDPMEKEPLWLAIRTTFINLNINVEWGESFLQSMRLDITKTRYQTFQELEEYMYGSAGVVGLFMAKVIGYTDIKALEFAKYLGFGMQLANFIRDIKMDLTELERIYIPLEDLQKFGLYEQDLNNPVLTSKLTALMRYEANRANDYFKLGSQALPYLSLDGRFAFLTALILYRQILLKIKQQNWDVWNKRASTSFLEKLWLCVKAKIKGYYDINLN